MSYPIRRIVEHPFVTKVNGRWQYAKPLRCEENYAFWIFRLKEAWEVFQNRAIAVTYDEPKIDIGELP